MRGLSRKDWKRWENGFYKLKHVEFICANCENSKPQLDRWKLGRRGAAWYEEDVKGSHLETSILSFYISYWVKSFFLWHLGSHLVLIGTVHNCVLETYQTGKAHHKHCETNHQLSHVPAMQRILESFNDMFLKRTKRPHHHDNHHHHQQQMNIIKIMTCCEGTCGRSGEGWMASTWKTLQRGSSSSTRSPSPSSSPSSSRSSRSPSSPSSSRSPHDHDDHLQ